MEASRGNRPSNSQRDALLPEYDDMNPGAYLDAYFYSPGTNDQTWLYYPFPDYDCEVNIEEWLAENRHRVTDSVVPSENSEALTGHSTDPEIHQLIDETNILNESSFKHRTFDISTSTRPKKFGSRHSLSNCTLLEDISNPAIGLTIHLSTFTGSCADDSGQALLSEEAFTPCMVSTPGDNIRNSKRVNTSPKNENSNLATSGLNLNDISKMSDDHLANNRKEGTTKTFRDDATFCRSHMTAECRADGTYIFCSNPNTESPLNKTVTLPGHATAHFSKPVPRNLNSSYSTLLNQTKTLSLSDSDLMSSFSNKLSTVSEEHFDVSEKQRFPVEARKTASSLQLSSITPLRRKAEGRETKMQSSTLTGSNLNKHPSYTVSLSSLSNIQENTREKEPLSQNQSRGQIHKPRRGDFYARRSFQPHHRLGENNNGQEVFAKDDSQIKPPTKAASSGIPRPVRSRLPIPVPRSRKPPQ